MNKELIGKRLATLRDELGYPGGEKWTQARVCAETGLTQNMLGRLEQAGAGSIEAFITYLLFFSKHGYNLNWILQPDNAHVSKRSLSDNTKAVDLATVVSHLANIKQVLDKEIDHVVVALEG